MIKTQLALTLAACLTGCASIQPTAVKEIALVTDQQKASYSNGVDYMKHLRQDELDVDQDAFLLGVNDVLANRPLRLTPQEITKADAWQMVEQVKHQNARTAANAKAGKAFLASNRNQRGVQRLASSLQYKILHEGSSSLKPKVDDTVAINYKLSHIDGSEIGSNAKQGRPLVSPLTKLIPGTKEALEMMRKGDRWQLFISPDLAYGENGTPDGKVKPNETLVFDLELVDINPPKALAATETKPVAQRVFSSTGQ